MLGVGSRWADPPAGGNPYAVEAAESAAAAALAEQPSVQEAWDSAAAARRTYSAQLAGWERAGGDGHGVTPAASAKLLGGEGRRLEERWADRRRDSRSGSFSSSISSEGGGGRGGWQATGGWWERLEEVATEGAVEEVAGRVEKGQALQWWGDSFEA